MSSLGCVICADVFSSADAADKYTLAIKNCGHAFHAACLKTWLTKSKTCPVCRAVCSDSDAYLNRLHLQSVNNLDASVCENMSGIDDLVMNAAVLAKDKEIVDLRKQLAECRSTIAKIRDFYNDTNKLHRHIGIELGIKSQDENITDSSSSSVSQAPPVVAPVIAQPAVRNSSTSVRSAYRPTPRVVLNRCPTPGTLVPSVRNTRAVRREVSHT